MNERYINKNFKNVIRIWFMSFRSRSNGNTKIIDFHIKLDPDLSLRAAHDIATNVENRIKNEFGPAVVNIHMEPYHSLTINDKR